MQSVPLNTSHTFPTFPDLETHRLSSPLPDFPTQSSFLIESSMIFGGVNNLTIRVSRNPTPTTTLRLRIPCLETNKTTFRFLLNFLMLIKAEMTRYMVSRECLLQSNLPRRHMVSQSSKLYAPLSSDNRHCCRLCSKSSSGNLAL